jgi:hypothetical protein
VVVNLGPRDAVAEKMTQWLSAIDLASGPVPDDRCPAMADLPLTDKLTALLSEDDVRTWLLNQCRGGAAPTWNHVGDIGPAI